MNWTRDSFDQKKLQNGEILAEVSPLFTSSNTKLILSIYHTDTPETVVITADLFAIVCSERYLGSEAKMMGSDARDVMGLPSAAPKPHARKSSEAKGQRTK